MLFPWVSRSPNEFPPLRPSNEMVYGMLFIDMVAVESISVLSLGMFIGQEAHSFLLIISCTEIL